MLEAYEDAGVAWKIRKKMEHPGEGDGKPLDDSEAACTGGDWSAFTNQIQDTPTLKRTTIREWRAKLMKKVPDDQDSRDRQVLEHLERNDIKLL